MKALRPEVRVLAGAAVPVPLPWFEDLLAAGASGAMDAVAVHPYRSTPEGVERAHWDLARDDHDFRTGLVRGPPCSLAPGVDFPITPAPASSIDFDYLEWRAQVSVPGAPPTTFAEWQGQNFTAAEFTDPLLSDDLSAPADDGVANLLRYASGLKRGTPVSLTLPRAGTIPISGAADLTLTYRRSITICFSPRS